MSELRRDPVAGNWVIIAPERGHRPGYGSSWSKPAANTVFFDPTCPFCPGNESQLPRIIIEVASTERPGWSTRAVGNKFPIVGQHVERCERRPFYEAAVARGFHEVVIESPHHDSDLTTMSTTEIRDVLLTYRDRHDALMAAEMIQSVLIFRNRGRVAGASLQHPHSQIVALEKAPPLVRQRQAVMAGYYQREKRCVLCDLIAQELGNGSRAVSENAAFVTVVPFAATAPFEMWLLPKAHNASFGEIDGAGAALLAAALRNALTLLSEAINGPPYNYVIDTATKDGLAKPHLHWQLRIVPQLTVPGGFELLSGLPINPHLPEEDATVLRSFRSAVLRR